MFMQFRRKFVPLSILDGQRADYYVPPSIIRPNYERECNDKYLSIPIWQILQSH